MDFEKAFELCHSHAFSNDCSLYEAALLACPELLLGLSDEYMAAMINKASEKYRNIMVICGYGQTRSIPYYLYFS
jgi:hypothetical protein